MIADIDTASLLDYGGSDTLHNVKEPAHVVLSESPRHRTMVLQRCAGMQVQEIAAETGYTVPWVSNVLRQPWAVALQAKILGQTAHSTIAKWTDAAEEAFDNLVQLSQTAESETVQNSALQYLVNRAHGMPRQSVVTSQGQPIDMDNDTLNNRINELLARSAT